MKTRNITAEGGLVIANDQGPMNRSGEIYLANEERFTAAHFSEPLTTYALGWTDPENLEAKLDEIAPGIQIGRRFEYKAADNAEAFLSETDDVRAIGSPFKRVEYKGSSANERTLNKGLTSRLDNDEMVEGSEELAVMRLRARLARNDIRRAVAILVTACTNTNKTWDTTAGKDPDQDVLSDLVTGGDARGYESNVIVYGGTAWSKRQLSLRAQNLAGQANSSTMTTAELAGLLVVDRVVVTKSRYQSATATKTQIVNAYVLMYYAQMAQAKDDPSNIKRFWTPTESGRVRVYREVHAKYVDISVEHYSNIVSPSSLGARKFTVS